MGSRNNQKLLVRETGKVFGIGLSRTGTSTLARALQILGLRTVHYPQTIDEIQANDAATDLPVAYSFERLDKTFPGSRFIYTVRPLDSWLKSCEAHFDRTHSPSSFAVQLRLDVFGRVDYDSPAFACAYSVHENRVRTYFKNRQMDLLVIDVTAPGQHWGALCSFLGRPRPVAAFPWLNRRTHVEALVRLLHRHLGSITTVAELLEARPQWVATIIAQDDTSGVPSLDDEGMNLAHLMTRITSQFGGVSAAAESLGIPEVLMRAAVERVHGKRQQLR